MIFGLFFLDFLTVALEGCEYHKLVQNLKNMFSNMIWELSKENQELNGQYVFFPETSVCTSDVSEGSSLPGGWDEILTQP